MRGYRKRGTTSYTRARITRTSPRLCELRKYSKYIILAAIRPRMPTFADDLPPGVGKMRRGRAADMAARTRHADIHEFFRNSPSYYFAIVSIGDVASAIIYKGRALVC